MNKKPLIKCVFVDFDGTLIDSIKGLYKAYMELLELYEIEGNKNEFNGLNGPSTFEIVEILKEKHDLLPTTNEIYDKYIELIDKNYSESKAFKDSESFLLKLNNQKIKTVLVTSSRSIACLPIINRLGWESYIDSYVWGEDVKNSKPSPDIYLKALKQANVESNEVIVIEDSVNGVLSASDAGLIVFGLSIDFKEDDLLKAGAQRVFCNLSSVLAHVLN
jgi:HAD superfamily hydrolase (TIGR01509 family)